MVTPIAALLSSQTGNVWQVAVIDRSIMRSPSPTMASHPSSQSSKAKVKPMLQHGDLDQGSDISDLLDIQPVGGVSTFENGFQLGWAKDESSPTLCLAINRKGEVFARFLRDKNIATANNLSRGEVEAIQGIKVLILKWIEPEEPEL